MIAPGATIGILGGGQLGRMLAASARQHGYGVAVLAPEGDAPAFGLADRVFRASFEDTGAARLLADVADVVTYEFENVPASTVRAIADRVAVHPSAELLAVTQDRVDEHAFVHRHGIPTAPGRAVASMDELRAGLAALGTPARLKTARGGYDGGGQWRIRDAAEAEALAALFTPGARFLLEREVAFVRELSVVVARSASGDARAFPVFENRHRDGILVETLVPAEVPTALADRARDVAVTLAEGVGLVGTLTVECFQTDGDVLVNELAPRVHNSGHLTVEACAVSQFEQHVRAICGLPLAEPALRSPACMVNLLGTGPRRRALLLGTDAAMAVPDAHLHVYGKSQVAERRKMGHVTALGATRAEAESRARRAAAALSWG